MTLYFLPVSMDWLKTNLKIIIGNRDLAEIMQFGDLWKSRGHIPLVHVVSPAMDNGKMWDKHEDPSGLLDNIPEHINLFIVDFYNREKPELPKAWENMKAPPKWLLWEYQPGKVKFNGTYQQFVDLFGVDPEGGDASTPETTPDTPPAATPRIGNLNIPDGAIVDIFCPDCGKFICKLIF